MAQSVSPGKSGTLLLAGMIVGPFYVLVGLLQMLFRPGYNPSVHDLSLLANGDFGWVQVTNFLVSGALLLCFAVGVRLALRGTAGGGWGPWLIGLYGLGLIGAGVFVADPMNGFPLGTPAGGPVNPTGHGFLHIIAGAWGFIGLIAFSFVMARRAFKNKRGGSGAFAIVTGVIFLAAFVGIATGSQAASAVQVAVTLAFTFAVVESWVWLFLLARELRASGAGR